MTDDNEKNFDLDLTPEERRAVEVWADGAAPGEERMAGFVAPRIPAVRRRGRWRGVAWQAAAACAIFVGGYVAGHAGADGGEARREVMAEGTVASGEQVAQNDGSGDDVLVDDVGPDEAATAEPEAVKTAEAKCPTPQVFQGRDGRFRVETVLCESGGHGTWVINPRLEIAKIAEKDSEGQQ